jgi:hypothetical protein
VCVRTPRRSADRGCVRSRPRQRRARRRRAERSAENRIEYNTFSAIAIARLIYLFIFQFIKNNIERVCCVARRRRRRPDSGRSRHERNHVGARSAAHRTGRRALYTKHDRRDRHDRRRRIAAQSRARAQKRGRRARSAVHRHQKSTESPTSAARRRCHHHRMILNSTANGEAA